MEGRALECLGRARLTVTLGTRVIEWSFIVAEIRDDEGILGNDFTMAHKLTVWPCEGAVYLLDLAGTGKGHMGERLPCTIRSVTEVRAVTEETLAVRAVGSATLAPHTVTQVRVIVPTPRARGTVMIDPGPGPLGLCRQLQAAMAARKHLFAKGKGDLGRTDIVQHQIHTGDQPAIKQRVRRYPAARREEERQLVEDILAIGIIQESNSAWNSLTILVKKKDGTTRFCIDYR